MESLVAAIREQEEVARFLAWPGDFDLDRGDHVEEVHLASGAALEGFAGDGAGGTYLFCGEGGEERPILYADSEGGAALIAIGLHEMVPLLLVVPWWRDCQAFTGEEGARCRRSGLSPVGQVPVSVWDPVPLRRSRSLAGWTKG
ncbi:hypothetical protein ACIQ1S_14915 [Streptomyces griseus]|uniref:hypothetical protein n=1 Tax=Streptomyces griseus TaxID=1911 RepID=UPI00381F0FF3